MLVQNVTSVQSTRFCAQL